MRSASQSGWIFFFINLGLKFFLYLAILCNCDCIIVVLFILNRLCLFVYLVRFVQTQHSASLSGWNCVVFSINLGLRIFLYVYCVIAIV